MTVLILPGNNQQGMLETLLCESFAGTPENDCIDAFFACVDALPNASIKRPEKARAHAYLTTKSDPHLSVGVAAKRNYWDLDHPIFDRVRDFLGSVDIWDILSYSVCMSNLILSANQWPKILAFIRECPRVYVGEEAGCNRFIAAVLWVMRSGGQWRQLPAQYGKWNTVYKRFARWCRYGVWERMHQHFTSDPDLACLIIDNANQE